MHAKQRQQRYEKIQRAKELLMLSRTRSLTKEEINELKTLHSGYGGLSRDTTQFFTPEVVADFMVKMLQIEDNAKVLEPAFGGGVFLNALLKNNATLRITGVELFYELYNIGTLCYKECNLYNGDTLDYIDVFKEQFDYVIGNPPFGSAKERDGYKIGGKRLEAQFLELTVNALKEGGKAALILPEGIFANASFKKLRMWLFDKCYYLGTVSLPENTFYFSNTSIKTSIMFIQKKYSNIDVGNYEILMAICEDIGWDNRGNPTGRCDLDKILNMYLTNVYEKQVKHFSVAKKIS